MFYCLPISLWPLHTCGNLSISISNWVELSWKLHQRHNSQWRQCALWLINVSFSSSSSSFSWSSIPECRPRFGAIPVCRNDQLTTSLLWAQTEPESVWCGTQHRPSLHPLHLPSSTDFSCPCLFTSEHHDPNCWSHCWACPLLFKQGTGAGLGCLSSFSFLVLLPLRCA